MKEIELRFLKPGDQFTYAGCSNTLVKADPGMCSLQARDGSTDGYFVVRDGRVMSFIGRGSGEIKVLVEEYTYNARILVPTADLKEGESFIESGNIFTRIDFVNRSHGSVVLFRGPNEHISVFDRDKLVTRAPND